MTRKRNLPRESEVTSDLDRLFGLSPAMQSVIAAIRTVAPASTSIVITGESGTGKELVARTIHQLSPRAAGPYVGINCAAIPETLMESELFGYERGAFTGAERSRAGCFETAQNGTLLLDEITEMHVGMQAKLLRVLEERRLRRVGGNGVIELNVRVLAASNRNLMQAVHAGQFRADLFYRLNVFPLHLPPLRERTKDLPSLVDSFIKHYAALNRKMVLGISQECVSALAVHPWPGNVRQLRNVIERAVILSEAPLIERRDLPDEFQAGAPVQDEYFTIRIGAPLSAIERQVILQTLDLMKGNQRRTAQALGVSIRTLHNKLKQYRRTAGSPVSDK